MTESPVSLLQFRFAVGNYALEQEFYPLGRQDRGSDGRPLHQNVVVVVRIAHRNSLYVAVGNKRTSCSPVRLLGPPFSLPSVTLSALDFCAPARAGQTSDYRGSEHFPQSTLERFRTRSTSSTPVRQGSRSGEFQPDPNVAAPARGRASA